MPNFPSNDFFATTRWTIVLAAGKSGTPQSVEALESLCKAYWFPLYAYVRRRGHSKEDAEDLTQAFFADLLERRDFTRADGERGKFRAYLLASLKHFLANEWDKSRRLKRGGNITHFPLDWESADTRFQIADGTQVPPDAAFDREWAVALLARVIVRLKEECIADGAGERFEELKKYLTAGKSEIPYADAAAALSMDVGAVRVAVHRLRKRYRKLLRDEVAQTLSDPAMLEDEMAALLGAFG